MKLRNLRPRTIYSYQRSVEKFREFLEPTDISAFSREDLRRYLLFLGDERQLAASSINVAHMAIRRFSEWTLSRRMPSVPTCRRYRSLPTVLSPEEVEAVLRVTKTEKHRAMLMTTYSAGLRSSETVHLRVADIDSARMRIVVRDGKGGKARHVMLSARLLSALRAYWRIYRPPVWLFTGKNGGPMSRDTLSRIFRVTFKTTGIEKPATLHSLRHSFATHLLESGTPLPKIKELLGHRSISSTMIYLKVANVTEVPSPLDSLAEDVLRLDD
jgi:site-specific recombinase XerD